MISQTKFAIPVTVVIEVSMVLATQQRLEQFMAGLIRRNPGEHEFHQAVHEVAEHIVPYIRCTNTGAFV